MGDNEDVLPLRVVLTLVLLLMAAGSAQSLDPALAKIPLERWLQEGDAGKFRWSVRVLPTELTAHQRLRTKVEIQVDGAELVSRRGHGQLLLLMQLEDSDHRVYQTHQPFPLDEVKDEASRSFFNYTPMAFVTPGEYQLVCGILDTQTGEHAVLQRAVHVNAPKNDALPNSWNGLPAVEMMQEAKPPDDLLLPYLKGRLHLSAETRRPVQVELVVNMAGGGGDPHRPLVPSPFPSNGGPLGRRDFPIEPTVSEAQRLGNLLAAMKVLSAMEPSGGNLHVTLLDVAKRKAVFTQELAPKNKTLDWPGLRVALDAADPNKIDVGALAGREKNGQFFIEQVRGKMAAAGSKVGSANDAAARAVIVLSSPMTLEGDKHTAPEAVAGGKLFYIRYHTPLPPAALALPELNRGRNGRTPPFTQADLEPFDSLLPLLKPLQPRVYDVSTPEQFRKVLASLLEEIGRL